MLQMTRDLVAHKGHANASMLSAIRMNAEARQAEDVWDLLHHILLATRFWLLTVQGKPFAHDVEARRAGSFDALIERYRLCQAEEDAWLAAATDDDLRRTLEHPSIPGGRCSVGEAFTQVCLHAHGHRAQCAKLLRRYGGTPPPADFILWLVERPVAVWPAMSE